MTIIECEKRIRSHLELCLAIQLNEAMTKARGPEWFETLKSEETKILETERDKTVLQRQHRKLEDCDFQAICKILCYREVYRLATFPKCSGKEDSKRLALLHNVIDFRNAVIAHKKILGTKTFAVGEYSYDNAVLDMMSLLRIFHFVKGPAPKPEDRPDAEDVTICYYDEAKKVFEQFKKEDGQIDYPVSAALASSGLQVSEDAFIDACNELGLDTFRPKGGSWHFSSKEPEKDIKLICEHFKQKALAIQLSNERMQAQWAEKERQRQQLAQAANASETEKKNREKARYILLGLALLVVVCLVVALLAGIGNTSEGKQADQYSGGNSYIDPGKQNAQVQDHIQAQIDNFVSDGLNTFDLKIGQSHKPTAATWLNGGTGSCYSTNNAVVTVASTGAVTAVSEGEAFVVYEAGIGQMSAVYKYVVKGVYQTQDQLIQEEIENFVPDGFNDIELKVGQGHKPTAATWLNGGSGSCYSTDTTVVTVASSGAVTAVGEGQAFVVIKSSSSMYSVTRYTVQGTYKTEDQLIQEEIDNFAPDSFNDFDLKVGQTHKHTSAVWLSGSSGSCHSTDPAVVTVTADGTVTAVGEGQAFVVTKGGSMHAIVRYTVTK